MGVALSVASEGFFILSNVCASVSTILHWASSILCKKPERAVNLEPATRILALPENSHRTCSLHDDGAAGYGGPQLALVGPRRPTKEQLIADAREKLGMDVRNHFNFAFVGQSGVGKSSLINALRSLKDSHPAAAPVGETETTTQIKKYAHPVHAHIMLWDLPGAGTLKQPASTYFEDNMLFAFDCILVLPGERFLKIDFEIAKKAMEYEKPCAFVRTKADQSLKSIAQRKEKTMADASKDLRLIVDESFQKGLKDAGFTPQTSNFQLFVVSAWSFTKKTAYMLYDTDTDELDTSLEKMDEDRLIVFVTNSARPRLS